jgi:hypothetical protein
MLKKTKKAQVWNWMKDHSFELTAGAAFTALTGAILVLAQVQAQEAKKQLTWIGEQEKEGHSVLYDAYGNLYSADVVDTYL